MKKVLVAACFACALISGVAQAQVKIDMSKITCAQVLAMPADDQNDYAAWMAGWYAQKSGRTFIDMGKFQQNFASVMDWCAANKSEAVMAGLQRAFDKQK
jgi:hypothetical protein